MGSINMKSVKGMNDIFSPDVFVWRAAEKIIREHFESFGFTEIKTPIVELTALFTRSVGDTTDIVQKEMYTFNDRNGESLTLRPEGTAPVVRALVEHTLLNQDPIQKLYYWGPMFRYERPQKGRYRQFHQYGIEIFGVASARADAELIALLVTLYKKFELKGLTVQLGSLGCENCRPKYREHLVSLLKPSLAALCPECQTRLEKNPLRVFDCKNPTCKEIASVLPSMLDFLDAECQKHFDTVRDSLVALQTPFVVDKTLVRGFDYYNRTVFEITTQDLGAQNAICGGGRYDKLTEELGGPSCPAVGFAGGVERLVLLLQAQTEKSWGPILHLFIVTPDEKGMTVAYPLAFNLRHRGVSCELDYTGKSMKSQMKKADKLQARYVLILGSSEIEKGIGIFRDMDSKNQTDIPLGDLENEILRRLS